MTFVDAISLDSAPSQVDFVWETTRTKACRDLHKHARVLNRLHNSQIVESKASFAFLQLRMDYPHVLQTFVASSSAGVGEWVLANWFNDSITTTHRDDWWAVKASRGSCGKDVWIMNASNYEDVTRQLPTGDEYVIQKYIMSPLLYKGRKKFHFRCYAFMSADGSAFVYRNCFINAASTDFDTNDTTCTKHITNVQVNRRETGYEGQVICDLATEYPKQFKGIQQMWHSVVKASNPFIAAQESSLHFEFFGLDVIVDNFGVCWLIEANRLPALEVTSDSKRINEELFFNDMMKAMLYIVLRPILPPFQNSDSAENEHTIVDTSQWVLVSGTYTSNHEDPSNHKPVSVSCSTWKNLLNWRLFTKKEKNNIVVG